MRLKPLLDQALGRLLALAMAVAVATVLWQVASRYLVGEPSSFTDELVRFLLIWIGLLGGSYACGQKMHLAIDLLPRRLEGAAKEKLAIVTHLTVAAFAVAVMGFGGVSLVHLTLSLGQTSAALGIPIGWLYTVLPISGLFITAYSLVFAAEHWRNLRRPEATD